MKTITFKAFISIAFLLVPATAWCDCVILLHGLARTDTSMEELEEKLQEQGYTTVNHGYPSREYSIAELAEKAIGPALEACAAEQAINFVTHSLGGILVRQYLQDHDIPQLNRVVMLGPPNQGSEVVDKLGEFPGFHFINGDAGLELGTGELSIPRQLGEADFDLGIIAGTRSINWILSSLIPDTDDGKVSVDSTKLEGMDDHIEMAVTHPFMMTNNKVIMQVIHYLEHGEFVR